MNYKIINRKRFTLALVSMIVVVSALIGIKAASAATLSVTPGFREVSDKELLTVDVRLNSERQVVNAVQAVITYPASTLEVVDVSHSNSFLTLWTKEPTVDSVNGTITMAGGVPNGSMVIDGIVAHLTFRIISIASAEIGFDERQTSVRLNDGLGTAAPLTVSSGIYKINAAVFTDITSPTHPEESVWYNNNSPIVRWQTETGALYSYTLSDDPTTIPDDLGDTSYGEVEYTNLHDGIHFFILKKKVSAKEWDLIGIRRIMIDTTPPRPIQVVIAQDSSVFNNQKYLMFTTTDAASGISHYQITESGTVTLDAKPPFLLKDQTLTKSVVITVYDKADNKVSKELFAPPAKSKQLLELLLLVIGIIIVLSAGLFIFIDSKRRK